MGTTISYRKEKTVNNKENEVKSQGFHGIWTGKVSIKGRLPITNFLGPHHTCTNP